MCLAQGHNPVKPLRLKPASTQSRGKHSTTEPLRSPLKCNPLLIISRVLINLVSILWDINKHHRTICTKLFSHQASKFQAKHFCKRTGNPLVQKDTTCIRTAASVLLKCNRPFITLKSTCEKTDSFNPFIFMGRQQTSQNQSDTAECSI